MVYWYVVDKTNQTLIYPIKMQVNQFKYLGSIINNDGRSEKEIRSRIGQSKRSFLLKSKLIT